MADITISYKGNTIAEISASGTTTLETAGKYCEDDITIEYVRPNVQTITDDSIYLYRLNPYNSTAKNVSKLVGCTYAWNQIAQFPDRSTVTSKGITFSIADGICTYSGTPTSSTGYIELAAGTCSNFISGHKYLIRVVDSNGGVRRKCYVFINNPYAEIPSSESNAKRYAIYAPTATPTFFLWRFSLVNLATDTQINGTAWVQAFDLTMMFGSTIANYIYGLGADACLAWFQNLFDKDYYPYDSGTLVSVKPTASMMTNADESSVSSYPLSGIELRGIPKLDANNNLYYDGDEYTADGTVKRRYGIVDLGTLNWTYRSNLGGMSAGLNPIAKERFYAICSAYPFGGAYSDLSDKQCGYVYNNHIFVKDTDYSDAAVFKTAMSGVYLIYELATPTTETTTGYTAKQTCYPNGTEEFVDGRTVEIPVNAVADYEVTS